MTATSSARQDNSINTPDIQQVIIELEKVILGKQNVLKLALTCLLAKGHLLIEDVPGMGKTTLSQALARVLGIDFQRIQFTSDLLPADVLGVSVFQRDSENFQFRAGPVFTQCLLADEINRATPKTQSALLEAMEERQVTVDGQTRLLPAPFFVIGTQNPNNQIGTFALPESQLDRFTMRITMGYLDAKTELQLLTGLSPRDQLDQLQPIADPGLIQQWQRQVKNIKIADSLIRYIQTILHHSRKPDVFLQGLSPRAGLAIKTAAQAWARLHQRDHVLPDDIQQIVPYVVAHRLETPQQEPATFDDIRNKLIKPLAIP